MTGKKILIIFALLFGLVAQASAADYYFVVNNVSQAELLDHVIDALNVFLDKDADINDSTVRYGNMLSFIVLVGILGVTVRLLMAHIGGNASAGFQQYVVYLFTIFVVMGLAYGPKKTVLVQTPYNTGYSVKTLPELAAWGFGAFLTVKRELDSLSSMAYDIPEPSDNVFLPGGPEGLGFVGGQSVLAGMYRNAQFSWYEEGGTVSSMWSSYVRDCFLLPAASTVGGDTALNNALKSSDLMTDLEPSATGYGAELIQYDGTINTCSDFWVNSMEPALLAFEDDLNTSSKYEKLGSALGYFGALMDATGAMSNASSLKAAVNQAVLSNEFSTTFSGMGIAGEVMADGAAQATADVQLNGISTGLYMAEQLPMVAFIVFLVMVAAFPFIIAFSLLPGTLSTIVNYMRTLLWVSLWEPMGNILGIFFDYNFLTTARELNFPTTGAGEMIINPSNLINVSSEAATMAGIAGFLFLGIQGLSWMLITGSGQMMGNLMSNFGNAFANRANADAQLAAQGEIAKQNMLSTEMGEHISMREMYQFGAMQEASEAAGGMGGAMSAYGTDAMGAGSAMTHTGTVKAAFGHGQDIGMTHELGSGTRAAEVSKRLSIQNTAKSAANADTLGSDETASRTGSVAGQTDGGAAIGGAEPYADKPFGTAAGVAEKNAARGASFDKGRADKAPTTEDAMQQGAQTGAMQGSQDNADAAALEKIDKNNVAALDAGTKYTAKNTAIYMTSDKMGVAPSVAVKKMVENRGVQMGGDAIKQDASHKAQGGKIGVADNADTSGTVDGSRINEEMKIHRDQGDDKIQQQAQYAASKTVGAAYKEAETVNQLRADKEKEAKELSAQAEKKSKDAKGISNAVPVFEDEMNSLNDEQKQVDAALGDMNARRHEAVEKFRNGEIDGKELREQQEQITEEKKALEAQKEDIQTRRKEAVETLSKTVSEKWASKQEAAALKAKSDEAQAQADSLDPGNLGVKEALQVAEGTGEVKNAEDNGIDGTMFKRFAKGEMKGEELNAFMEQLDKAGISPTDVAAAKGSIDAINRSGEYKTAEAVATKLLEDFNENGNIEVLSNLGIDENSTAQEVVAAVEATAGYSRKFVTKDGADRTLSFDDKGDAARVQHNEESTYRYGADVKTNTINAAFVSASGGVTKFNETKAITLNAGKAAVGVALDMTPAGKALKIAKGAGSFRAGARYFKKRMNRGGGGGGAGDEKP